jgi:ribosomal protein L37E
MDLNVGQVCRKCGLLGYYNYKLKTSYCSMCKNGENMAKMRLPYACKLLFQVGHNFLRVLVQLCVNSTGLLHTNGRYAVCCRPHVGVVIWFQELQSMNVVPRLTLAEG